MEFYVIFFRNRCMGFHVDGARAQEIADLLGEGSDVEACTGDFPTDEAVAAREHNERRTKRNSGGGDGEGSGWLRAVKSGSGSVDEGAGFTDERAITLKLSPVESEALASAMGLAKETDGLSDDPWADEPTQTFIGLSEPGESGFFAPAQVG